MGVLLPGGGRSPPAADWLCTLPHLGYSLPATPVTRSQPDTDGQRWARQLKNLHHCLFASLLCVTVELHYHVVNCFLPIPTVLEDGGNFLDATETLVCTLPPINLRYKCEKNRMELPPKHLTRCLPACPSSRRHISHDTWIFIPRSRRPACYRIGSSQRLRGRIRSSWRTSAASGSCPAPVLGVPALVTASAQSLLYRYLASPCVHAWVQISPPHKDTHCSG